MGMIQKSGANVNAHKGGVHPKMGVRYTETNT